MGVNYKANPYYHASSILNLTFIVFLSDNALQLSYYTDSSQGNVTTLPLKFYVFYDKK